MSSKAQLDLIFKLSKIRSTDMMKNIWASVRAYQIGHLFVHDRVKDFRIVFIMILNGFQQVVQVFYVLRVQHIIPCFRIMLIITHLYFIQIVHLSTHHVLQVQPISSVLILGRTAELSSPSTVTPVHT